MSDDPGPAPNPQGADEPPAYDGDRLYLDLKGARERLCRASVHIPAHWRSDVSQAVRIIDEVGSSLVSIWSKDNQPEYPGAKDVTGYVPEWASGPCTCRREERPLGRWPGTNIDMGRRIVRLGTTPNCPVHDSCRGFTKANRAARPSWSNPYCPKHPKTPCPEVETDA